jgi:hypothetical protein
LYASFAWKAQAGSCSVASRSKVRAAALLGRDL